MFVPGRQGEVAVFVLFFFSIMNKEGNKKEHRYLNSNIWDLDSILEGCLDPSVKYRNDLLDEFVNFPRGRVLRSWAVIRKQPFTLDLQIITFKKKSWVQKL